MTPRVLMYTTGVCPYCGMAERLLKSRGVEEIEKIRIDQDELLRIEMMERTGRRTVPQIYIGSTHVGGFDDLVAGARPVRRVDLERLDQRIGLHADDPPLILGRGDGAGFPVEDARVSRRHARLE